jgi:hypothetical protein
MDDAPALSLDEAKRNLVALLAEDDRRQRRIESRNPDPAALCPHVTKVTQDLNQRLGEYLLPEDWEGVEQVWFGANADNDPELLRQEEERWARDRRLHRIAALEATVNAAVSAARRRASGPPLRCTARACPRRSFSGRRRPRRLRRRTRRFGSRGDPSRKPDSASPPIVARSAQLEVSQ